MWPRWCPILLLAAAAGAFAQAASATEARVRVRGSSQIEAGVEPSENGTELKGVVTDDTGRPVASARVEVRWTAPSGSALVLPPHESCRGGGAVTPRESPGYAGPAAEISIDSDLRGRFCVRFPLDLPDGRLLLGYVDTRGLLDGTSTIVNLSSKSDLELRFAPPPPTISLDREEATLLLEARARAGRAARGPEPLVVDYHPDDSPPIVIGRRQMSAGEVVRLTFPTSELRAPGAGELRAVLGSGDKAAEVRARVVTTATVRLVTDTKLEADASGVAELDVRLESRLASVASGSVEALSGGRTVGIAPVVAGRARLTLRLGSGARQVPVTLRYLSSTPWWLPGPERPLEVSVVAPNPLRRMPWAVVLVVLGIWIGLSWRRPRSAERTGTRPEGGSKSPRPALAWFPAPGVARGWSGQILDAHDESAIPGARIEIVTRFGTASATSDAQGLFTIDAEPDQLDGAISISAAWHAPFRRALPPPGRLRVALVTRRRALLARLVELAGRAQGRVAASGEPTPHELVRHAAETARTDIAAWAHAVEGAAYGPEPVDAERESAVRALEPREL
jgi:hypothetical protein